MKNKQIGSDVEFVVLAEHLRWHTMNAPNLNPPAAVCVVCMSSPRTLVLMRCGHFAVCNICYDKLERCPICRGQILGVLRYLYDH